MHRFKVCFIVVFVVFVFTMIVSQFLLKNDFYKSKLSLLHKMESKYVFSEQDVKRGYIVVEITHPSESLFLLQNGEKMKTLTEEFVKVEVSDNSVIEIEGRNSKLVSVVKIIEISDGVSGFYEKEINVESNVVIMGRFFVK